MTKPGARKAGPGVAASVTRDLYLVAAANAPTEWKSRADYVADGTNDVAVLTAAQVAATANGTRKGRVNVVGDLSGDLSVHPTGGGARTSVFVQYNRATLATVRPGVPGSLAMKNNQPAGMFKTVSASGEDTAVVMNYNAYITDPIASNNPNEDLAIYDLVVDGNGINQPGAGVGVFSGIVYASVDRPRLMRVVSKNAVGSSGGGSGEKWLYKIYECRDMQHWLCLATTDDGSPGATGFGHQYCEGFTAHGAMAIANGQHGINQHGSVNGRFIGGYAIRNGGSGSLCEGGRDMQFIGLRLGGEQQYSATHTWGASADITDGNGGNGFSADGTERLVLDSLIVVNNGTNSGSDNGISLDATAAVSGSGGPFSAVVMNCISDNNIGKQLNFLNGAAPLTLVKGTRLINGTRGTAQIRIDSGTPTIGHFNLPTQYGGIVPAAPRTLAMPASGGTVTFDYPYMGTIQINGGTTVAVTVDGIAMGAGVTTIPAYPGAVIGITYAAAPTWTICLHG